MVRSVTSPAQQKRRRDIRAAAMVRARASRLAAEAARAAAAISATTAAAAALRNTEQVRAEVPTSDVAEVALGDAPESKVVTWIREHGDANKMTVVSNDERNGSGVRVWVIRCGACDTVVRATGATNLQRHAATAVHAAALDDPAHARESKGAAWMREHGEANTITVVSNDEFNGSHRLWVVRCGACDMVLRATGTRYLEKHAASAAHAAALDPAHALESNVAAWIREHGEVNKMTAVSKDEFTDSHRVWRIRCGACDKLVRATGAGNLQKHAETAAHAAALDPANAPEAKVPAWIREHGEANKMTVVSNDHISARGWRAWTVRCAACDTVIRAHGAAGLQRHIVRAVHAIAMGARAAPELKVTAWIREHGEANRMTVVSNDEITSQSARVWVVRCDACDTEIRATNTAPLQIHASCGAHAAALDPARARESAVARWMREQGDANTMTVVSNDEIVNRRGHSRRRWLIRCGVCETVIRINATQDLRNHTATAAHAAALDPAHTPEARDTKVARWIREHGDANTMTVVSNDEINGNGARVWVMRCNACDTEVRTTSAGQLQLHVGGGRHVAALDPARAPESKVAKWIREHGDANMMTLLPKDDVSARGSSQSTVRCSACDKVIRVGFPSDLQKHVTSAAHAAALAREAGRPKCRGAQRKRPR
jgi:rRNA maturation endonuclease Nob1